MFSLHLILPQNATAVSEFIAQVAKPKVSGSKIFPHIDKHHVGEGQGVQKGILYSASNLPV